MCVCVLSSRSSSHTVAHVSEAPLSRNQDPGCPSGSGFRPGEADPPGPGSSLGPGRIRARPASPLTPPRAPGPGGDTQTTEVLCEEASPASMTAVGGAHL